MKVCLFSVFIFCYLGCGNASPKNHTLRLPDTSASHTILQVHLPDTLSIIAVGDMMFGTNFPGTGKLPPNDGKDLLGHFTAELRDADITFGNSEGVFLDAGGVPKGSGQHVYCFREPTRYARYFADNGFDLLSVANNHVADFGETGMRSTISTLQALPLHFAGLQQFPTTIITVRNIKIGLAAFAPHKGCIQMNDLDDAIASVKELKRKCDIVMVSFHGGAEGRNHTHVPKITEIFMGQNRGNVYRFAHAMIDAGADIVIGHGPHVARAMELYKNKFIAYSLGNFCTYGMFNLDGVSGIAPLIKIYMNDKGDFINGHITSIKQLGEGGPLPDNNHGAYKLIRSLTSADLTGGHLLFPDSTNIVKD